MSSHNAKLNFQLKNDCLLALKMMCDRRYLRKEASQIVMFSSGVIPPGNPYYTISQILQTVDALTAIQSHPNKESIRVLITDIISSTLSYEGPRESIKLLNVLQPLLMESLLLDGFSINLSYFIGPSTGLKKIQNSSTELNKFREAIVDYIARSSPLSLLIDPQRDSAMKKLIEQLGFLGHQLQYNGRLYSTNLVQDCYRFLNKCCRSTRCYDPLEANGFVNSSFSHGLDQYEELLHSIAAREKIMRTSKGLAESGNLFKNMMAILRDVIIVYDGTIRTSCSKSVVQFDARGVSRYVTPGDSVGTLAATAVANAAYKAVLDPNQNNMTSWDSMQVRRSLDLLFFQVWLHI
jgi:DNA-directed RNA polymerase V subunit 1